MMGEERIEVATKKLSFLGFNPGPIFSYHFARDLRFLFSVASVLSV